VRRVHQAIVSLIIGNRCVTAVSDQTMERHQPSTSDPQPARRGFLASRDWDRFVGSTSVDAWSVAPMNSGPSLCDGDDVATVGRESSDHRDCHRSDPVWAQLQAIRRSMWILNATLESLPAKIELARWTSAGVTGRDGFVQLRHTHRQPGDDPSALEAERAKGGWRTRWKLARLQARADRAERRAAVAVRYASASYSAAFEALLRAATARAIADQACGGLRGGPSPLQSDKGDKPGALNPAERNSA
jgi:hypothetical protein